VKTVLKPWAAEVFFQGGTLEDFFRVAKRIFTWGASSGEISFYPLETTITTLFATKLIGKYQISQSRGANHPWTPLPTPMVEAGTVFDKDFAIRHNFCR